MGLCVAVLAVFIAVKKGYKSSDVKDPDPAVKIIIDAVPSLLAVIIVMGGILAGFFTATEAGVVLCLYCGLLSILYKEMTFKSFYNLLADTMESSATILFLIAASSIMSYVMSYSGIPAAISNALMSVSSNRYVILLIMNVFLLVMGMFLDLTPAVLIFTPIFLPITRSIGMSDVQFGIMLIMNLGIGSPRRSVPVCSWAAVSARSRSKALPSTSCRCSPPWSWHCSLSPSSLPFRCASRTCAVWCPALAGRSKP
jgi:tripartite ATP-independent transporter DctM subunit